jgi:hypothetical protein
MGTAATREAARTAVERRVASWTMMKEADKNVDYGEGNVRICP